MLVAPIRCRFKHTNGRLEHKTLKGVMTMNQAYLQGLQHGIQKTPRNTISILDNPYPPSNANHLRWREGYKAGLKH